jgi:hypothetical protein
MTRTFVLAVALGAALASPSVVASAWRVQARPAPAAQGTASISGLVTRVDNGKPIARAMVLLIPGPGLDQPRGQTDAAGRFEFANLAAGAYTLLVTADGFVSLDATVNRPSGAGKAIALTNGQRVEKIDVQLALPSAIEGRVLDEFGEPAPGVTIQLAQMMYAVGKTRLMPGGGNLNTGPTDDRGHFRFFGLPPGEYYVMALSGPFGRSNGSAFSSVGDGLAGFAPTYFPGTPRAVEAKPVLVGVGKDATDVTFALAPARMVTVSGHVTAGGQPVARVNVMLLQTQGGDLRAMIPANATSGPDGAFSYRNVPAGTYVLQGFGADAFGSTFFTVPATDDATALTDVAVMLRPLTTARGHITFEGGTPPPLGQVYAGFLPTDFASGPAGGNRIGGPPNADGTFAIGHLAWTGVVSIMAPAPWRMKSVTLDGRDITDVPSDFQSHDVSGLDVVMTAGVGSIAGTVLDGAAPAANSYVFVFPDDSAKWVYPGRLLTGRLSNAQGVFNVAGLLPGGYLVVALQTRPANVIDPDWVQTLVGAATPCRLAEGESATLALKLVKR